MEDGIFLSESGSVNRVRIVLKELSSMIAREAGPFFFGTPGGVRPMFYLYFKAKMGGHRMILLRSGSYWPERWYIRPSAIRTWKTWKGAKRYAKSLSHVNPDLRVGGF